MRVDNELTIVRNSILVVGEHEVLAAGPVLEALLGDKRVPELAGHVSDVLGENPDRTIFVDPDTIEEGIRSGVSAAVIGRDSEGRLGAVYGFSRFKDHAREGGEVLQEGVTLDLDNAIEAGSMLGNGFALRQDRPVNPYVAPGQGSRAIEAVVHLAKWQLPEKDVLAATNQMNGKGAGAVTRAGGVLVGYKPTTRLEHPKPKPGELSPQGPVHVDIYQMNPTGNFVPKQRRTR